MGALQPWHLIIVLVIALLIFGPGKLPDLGALTGQAQAPAPQLGQRKATKSNKRKKRQKSRR